MIIRFHELGAAIALIFVVAVLTGCQTSDGTTYELVIGGGDSNPAGIDDPAYRQSISNNVSIARVDESCEGLFVPKVEEELFRGAIPVWNIYFLNNSENRYEVRYDISYTKSGSTYFGNYNEQLTEERSATVRPGVLIQLPALKSGIDVEEVTEVNVFRCVKVA